MDLINNSSFINASDASQEPATGDVFYFPDFSKDEAVAPINSVRAIDLAKFKGSYVQIEGWNAIEYHGRVFTIDPVSLCVVLGRKRVAAGAIEVEFVMGHIVKSIKLAEHHPWSGFISISELETLFERKVQVNETVSPELENIVPTFSKESLEERKAMVKAWLQKNLLPVTEQSDCLTVAGGVTIHPPYVETTCSSKNHIIQNKIGKILSMMPDKN